MWFTVPLPCTSSAISRFFLSRNRIRNCSVVEYAIAARQYSTTCDHDANADPYFYRHTHLDTEPYLHPDSNVHPYANSDPNADRDNQHPNLDTDQHTVDDTDGNSYRNSDAHTNEHAYRDTNAHSDEHAN